MPRLKSLFPGLIHLREVGLARASDNTIWDWARVNGFAVITTDSDFIALSRRLGWPPKVIHLEECDFPLRVIEDQLRRSAVRISEFHKNRNTGVLALRFATDFDGR